MRVLFITNYFPPAYSGGAEVSLYHTCRGLLRRGVHCSILFVNHRATEPIEDWYELDGIPVHRVNFCNSLSSAWRDVFDWRVFQAVRAELKHLRPNIVHIHNVSGASLAPYLACRWMKVPVVNTLHDAWLLCPNNMLFQKDGTFCDPVEYPQGCQHCFQGYDYWGTVPYRRAIFSLLTSNVKFFTPPSQALIREHEKAGYNANRMRLVRLGFEPPSPTEPTHSQVRNIIETSHQYRTIVFAGGGIKTKGCEVVLSAIPQLLDSVDNLRIVVAGGGEEIFLNRFRQYEPEVQVLGRVPFKDMRALFASADLTLLPSIWLENSPVVIFESFQVGTPVVGTNFGGIPEFITEGKTGYLFPVGEAQILVEKVVCHFQRPPSERRQIRLRCVKKIRQTLPLDNHIQSLNQIYEEVLSQQN